MRGNRMLFIVSMGMLLGGCISNNDSTNKNAMNNFINQLNRSYQSAAYPNSGSSGYPNTSSSSNGSNYSNNKRSYEDIRVLTTPDNKEINLSGSPQGPVSGRTPDGQLEGYNLQYSFYGAWLADGDNYAEVLNHGIRTELTDMPSTGAATYIGRAERWDSINGSLYRNASTTIHVDFADHSLSGEIVFPGMRRNITLHRGRIIGNEFSGAASVIGNSSGDYDGRFYGPNAQEIGGIVSFSNNKALNTAFGGRRY